MAIVELDSFVTKFRHLLSAGFNATLTLEAVNGKATVCLRSELGVSVPPPPCDYRHRQPPLQRGPAYWRRQERRKAAAAAKVAVEEAVKATVLVTDKVDSVPLAEEVREQNDKKEDVQVVVNETEKEEKTTEEVGYSCELCNFTSNWKNGLSIHLSRKHSKIEEIDGNISIDSDKEDEKYIDTERYWETGILTTIFQSYLDANHIVECSTLSVLAKVVDLSFSFIYFSSSFLGELLFCYKQIWSFPYKVPSPNLCD